MSGSEKSTLERLHAYGIHNLYDLMSSTWAELAYDAGMGEKMANWISRKMNQLKLRCSDKVMGSLYDNAGRDDVEMYSCDICGDVYSIELMYHLGDGRIICADCMDDID